ncbi:uncharacterized protein TNCV_221891 [Trichonephila clavipes]|nr:uncharacterized protein TNCV_221891 [Trichonephila clavipes]
MVQFILFNPHASPVVLTRKNNDLPPDSPEAYRFAIDYRKLNAITKYPRYPLPVIDDLITNIPHTNVMSTLDLKVAIFSWRLVQRHRKNRVYHSQWHVCIPPHAFWPFWGGAKFRKGYRYNPQTCYWVFRVRLYGRCYHYISIV